jgi:outer membrane protein OmpA-like peptidoglycan-associated protein
VTKYPVNTLQYYFKKAIILLLVHFCTQLAAQNDLNHTVQRLSPSVNSEFEESKPITSPEADLLFFVRSFHPLNRGGELSGEDIWYSVKKGDAGWSMASNELGQLNNVNANAVVGYVQNKKTIYTVSYIMKNGNRFAQIVRSVEDAQGWSKSDPIGLEALAVGKDYHDFYVHPDEDVILISMKALNTIGREDLYVAVKQEPEVWSNPLHLGPIINTSDFEISPFLSKDKKTLFFASNGHSGYGDADIFKSTRLDESWTNWSVPENLGVPINSTDFDAYYFKNEQGKIFFCSNRGKKYTDIFTVVPQVIDPVDSTLSASSAVTASVESESKSTALRAEDSIAVFFDFNEHKLLQHEQQKLDQFIANVDSNRGGHMDIVGYTDQVGTDNYNLKLSKKRARAVFNYIKKQLNDDFSISYTGKGIYSEGSVSPEFMRKVDVICTLK